MPVTGETRRPARSRAGELGRGALELRRERVGAVAAASARRLRVRGRRGDPDARLAVVGREHPDQRAVGHDQLDALPRDAGVVRVEHRAAVGPLLGERRPDRAGDPRPEPVGPDDVPRVDRRQRAGPVLPVYADDPAVCVAADPGDGEPRAEGGPGVDGRVDQQRVDHLAAGRDEQVDARRVLDGPADGLAGGGEPHLTQRGCAAREHVAEQAPALQLDDAGARQLVGRDRVGREERAVHHPDVVAEPGEQQRGGCARSAGSDDHDVVAVPVSFSFPRR